jgi:hypothetical protein
MTRYQDLLDDAIGIPPPSTVDIDAVMSRQRRRVRYQQAGLVASTAAVTLGAAVALAMLPLGHRSPSVPSTQPASPPAPSREQEAARLSTALHELMTQVLPDAQFQKYGTGGRPAGEPLQFLDEGDHFGASAAIKDSAGTGAIYVSVGKEPSSFRDTHKCDDGPMPLDVQVTCEVQQGPAGAIVMVMSTTEGAYKRWLVEVIRPDNNSVYVDMGSGTSFEAPQRPAPPLTKAQTIALAEDPSLATSLS